MKFTGVVIGVAAMTTGVVETLMSNSSIFGPISLSAGGVLLIAVWFANRVAKVAERFVEGLGEKVVSLPTKEELERDKESLFSKLEHFSKSFDAERHETSKFREQLASTLADHNARLVNLERKL